MGGVLLSNAYKELSSMLANFFVKHGTVEKDKFEVYAYGFEVLLSTIVYTAIFIAIAAITETLIPSLVFYAGFFIVRTISGGYHAKTYISCHLLFTANQLAFISVLKLTPTATHIYITSAMVVTSSILVFMLAPVAHPNKPFIKSEKKRFRKYSCIYAALLVSVFIVIAILIPSKYVYYLLSYAVGTFSAAVSLVSAKILYK